MITQLSLIADPVVTLTVHRPVKGFEVFLARHDPFYENGEVSAREVYRIPVDKKAAFLEAVKSGGKTI
jgi:hypothetical protein